MLHRDPRIKRIRDPEWHIREIQQVKYMPQAQVRIIRAVRDHRRVAIRACHGIGKTFTLGHIVPWFVSTHAPSKTITTAPTNRQVNGLLWSEIRTAVKGSRYRLGGEVLETPYWKIRDDWFAMGFSPEKGKEAARDGEDSNSAGQGFHSENMLIVVDEATGVPPVIWTQIDGMATSKNARVVAIGNPTSKKGEFYKKFSSRAWHSLQITCFDSPNISTNGIRCLDDLKRELDRLLAMSQDEMMHTIQNYRVWHPSLLTLNWVMTMALPEEWGIDSVKFQTRILSEWPEIEEDAMFSEKLVADAIARKCRDETLKAKPKCRYIGVDPARQGLDKTVITVIEDWRIVQRIELSGKDTAQQAGQIMRLLINAERCDDEKVIVDSTGVGAGVIDSLKEKQAEGLLPAGVMLIEFHNGAKAAEETDPSERQRRDERDYFNKKAKALDLLAKDMRANLCLSSSPEVYSREMPTIIYDYNSKGQMRVESKEDYAERTGMSSPDSTESLAYANYGRHLKHIASRPRPRITAL